MRNFKIVTLLFLLVILHTTAAYAGPITLGYQILPVGFNSSEGRDIPGQNEVYFVGAGGGEKGSNNPTYVKSSDITKAIDLEMPQYQGVTATSGVVTGINDSGIVTADFQFGDLGRVFWKNVITGSEWTLVNPNASTSDTGNLFSSGIAGNTIFGFTAQSQPFSASLNGDFKILDTPAGGLGTGSVFDGRVVDGKVYLGGSVFGPSGNSSLALWTNDLLLTKECGIDCYITNIDPTGSYASVTSDGIIGHYNIATGDLVLPTFAGQNLFGISKGLLAGENSVTGFYLNAQDQFRLYVYNELLGFNITANEFCADPKVGCGDLPSLILNISRINLSLDNQNIAISPMFGSMYGATHNVPDARSTNSTAVPEPRALHLALIGFALLFPLASSTKLQLRRAVR